METDASLVRRIAAHATGSNIHRGSRMLALPRSSTATQRTSSPRP
jgi:hypothetical protein